MCLLCGYGFFKARSHKRMSISTAVLMGGDSRICQAGVTRLTSFIVAEIISVEFRVLKNRYWFGNQEQTFLPFKLLMLTVSI